MKKTTIKRAALQGTREYLQQALSLPGQKFSYAVSRNLSKIESEMVKSKKFYDGVLAAIPLPDVTEYEKDRRAMQNEYCQKGEDGQLISENGMYKPIDEEQYANEYKKFTEKYPEVTEAINKRLDAEREFLNEDVEIEFYSVNEENLSPQISGHQRFALSFMIEDDVLKVV